MKYIGLEFPRHTADEASARGRNGPFDPRKAEVNILDFSGYRSIAVNVYSKRDDGAPPIRLRLPVDEWVKLAEAVKKMAEEGEV